MADSEDPLLSCARWEEFVGAYNRLSVSLPPETRSRMKEIMLNYFSRFGHQGVFERMNNRTISQIMAEYEPGQIRPVVSGETEGVRYDLYPKTSSGEVKSKEQEPTGS